MCIFMQVYIHTCTDGTLVLEGACRRTGHTVVRDPSRTYKWSKMVMLFCEQAATQSGRLVGVACYVIVHLA
jgi:hypothetical protein